MDLKAAPIKKVIFAEGASAGIPCILLDCLSKEAKTRDVNEVISELLTISKIKTVLVKGKISEQTEIKTVLSGLSARGKSLIFITPASEDISVVRMVRNLAITLVAKPPTKDENNIKQSNFGYLMETDTVKFNIKSLEDYEKAKDFILIKKLKIPSIDFSINNCKDFVEVLTKYLEDCEQFLFKTRITKILTDE